MSSLKSYSVDKLVQDGKALHLKGEYIEAISYLEELITRTDGPGLLLMRSLLGDCYVQASKKTCSVEMWHKGINILVSTAEEGSSDAMVYMGIIFMSMKDYSRAESLFRMAIADGNVPAVEFLVELQKRIVDKME